MRCVQRHFEVAVRRRVQMLVENSEITFGDQPIGEDPKAFVSEQSG